MTPEAFRKLALALPEVEERGHHDHPDFRVGGRVFATLAPDGTWAMVKLPVDEQERLCAELPDLYEPFNGAWGKQGCTRITLAKARKKDVEEAVKSAWVRGQGG